MGRATLRMNGGLQGHWIAALVFGLILLPGVTEAADDLLELSLEDLMNVEVTSVSKKSQSRHDTAAAITVISSEDLRRGGFTSIPEALRLVPGLKVMQLDANRWVVSVRGFSQEFSNKLLVMIDGRTVYTPLFGGVYWDVQDYPIEDIDRIEVIRGPGGTVWGANAVNGVINVITKHSDDTQGALASLYGGNQEYGGTGRFGGQIGDHTSYRVFGKGFAVDDMDFDHRTRGDDGWESGRVGFRLDSELTDRDELRVSAEYYDLSENSGLFDGVSEFNEAHFTARGGNVILGWQRDLGDGDGFEAKVYYDRTERNSASTEDRHIVDGEFVHDASLLEDFGLIKRLGVTWGIGYRFSTSHFKASTVSSVDPNDEDQHITNAFAQFEIALSDIVSITAGAKLGYDSFSTFEYQPSGRIAIKPYEGHTFWLSLSRAVRTPTQLDRDLRVNIGGLIISGDRDLRSEELFAVEAGYRFFQFERATAEISAFYNSYEDLIVLEGLGGPNFGFSNQSEARILGFEIEVNLLPTEWWRLTLGYSYLLFEDENTPPNPLSLGGLKGSDPKHQFVGRSLITLPFDLELDTSVYYMDSLRARVPFGRTDNIKQFVRLDVRVGWKPREWLELAAIGRNLTDPAHPEFYDVQRNESSQVPRSFLGKATLRF